MRLLTTYRKVPERYHQLLLHFLTPSSDHSALYWWLATTVRSLQERAQPQETDGEAVWYRVRSGFPTAATGVPL